MNPSTLLTGAVALTLLALHAPPASGAPLHGSTQPPPGSGLTGMPEPAGPNLSPFGGPPGPKQAPGPGKPVSGPSPGGGGGGAGGRVDGGAAVSGPSTGVDRSFDPTHWSYWWDLNKEPYLAVRSHVRTGAPVTGTGEFFLGEGERTPEAAAQDAAPEDVRERIVPALMQVLENDPPTSVISGLLIALARIGDDLPPEGRADVERAVLPFLARGNQEVVETATVALGILGLEGSVPLLGHLLSDDETGRAAVRGSSVSTRTRAFAAYALGLVAHETRIEDMRRFAVTELVRAFEADESATPDVRAACVLALGLAGPGVASPSEAPEAEDAGGTNGSGSKARSRTELSMPPSASRKALVEWLLALLDDEQLNRVVRAQAPISLARLIDDAPAAERAELKELAAPAIVAHISTRSRSPREVMQSCAIALGRLGDRDSDRLDARIRRTLTGVGKVTPDHATRSYALIACGRVGGRAGDAESDEGLRELRRHFQRELGRGNAAATSFAVLGAALLERGNQAGGGAEARKVRERLASHLERSRSLDEVGSTALALGLARDYSGSEDVLLEKLEGVRGDRTRGYVALGLALMGSGGSRESIRELAAGAEYQPLMLMDAATALALLGDRKAVPLLIDMLKRSGSLAAQASIASSLGRIGDARSIGPLLEMLMDEDLTDGARAYAAVALGRAGDADLLPWNTPYAVDSNVATAPATLYDGSGMGLLNIL